MKYFVPITVINNYDIDLLAQEIRAGGLLVQAIHIGNGVLVFEFQSPLTDAEKTLIQKIVASHSPICFEKTKVKCAEDVDKITAMRIRNLMGDDDPVQGQLAKLTEMVESLCNGIIDGIDTANTKAKITNVITKHKAFLDMRKTIIQEGKDFKIGKGW